ncbi:hypothetical protein NX059_007146 [Plenodomus lindquistii]|nr:hypothetical protein NX059_007146 [Plenodomus lindquistii]
MRSGEKTNLASSTPSNSWKGWLWDTAGVPPAEKKFLRKLDATLLVFGFMGMFIKGIDTANATNAFVSGMKEDLELYGNEYNWIHLAWIMGHIVGQIPSNLILTRVPAHMWIPAQEISWTAFTFALAGANSFPALLGLRFAVGLTEAGYWPALYYLLGSWYNKRELGKRSGILQSAAFIAPIISGQLQAGVYNGLNGKAGLAGWRWLFIINGIISTPIALAAYFFLPDTPACAKPTWVFSQREIQLGINRMDRAGRRPEGNPYTWKMIGSFLLSWKTLLFTLVFAMQSFVMLPHTSFIFWMKAHNKPNQPPVYSVAQINQYPTTANAFMALWCLICVWVSDGPMKGRRWPIILFSNMVAVVIFVLLAATPVMGKFSHRAPLYIVSTTAPAMIPLTMSWMTEILSDNAEQRAFTAASMNTLQYAFYAWVPLVWFQQVHQPFVTPGNRGAAVVAGLNIVAFSLIAFLAQRDRRRFSRAGLNRVSSITPLTCPTGDGPRDRHNSGPEVEALPEVAQ